MNCLSRALRNCLTVALMIAVLSLFLFGNAYARKGCCSWHGGVASCDSSVGRLICNDGTYSPSCTCEKSNEATTLSKPLQEQANSTAIEYGNKITVMGLVFKEYFYEQPNYGQSPETDVIVDACILKLDSQLVMTNQTKLEELHLVPPAEQNITYCSQLAGHRVEVSGALDEGLTGHHHGDALLIVDSFKILR